MTEQTFSAVQVEAALCIWEWMLESREGEMKAAAAIGAAPWQPALVQLWENVGTSQMRDLAARIAPAVEALYGELCAEVGEDELRQVYCAYDWEFIPAVCMLLDWSGDMVAASYRNGLIALPDTVKPALLAEYAELKAKDDAARAEREKLATYTAECRHAAGRIWGYPGLVDDDPETVKDGLLYGIEPAALAETMGKEFDIARPDPLTAQMLAELYPAR